MISYGAMTKNFCHAWRILAVKGVGVGVWVNPLKKQTLWQKSFFFSDNVEWSSKNLWKIIFAAEKAHKNNKK